MLDWDLFKPVTSHITVSKDAITSLSVVGYLNKDAGPEGDIKLALNSLAA